MKPVNITKVVRFHRMFTAKKCVSYTFILLMLSLILLIMLVILTIITRKIDEHELYLDSLKLRSNVRTFTSPLSLKSKRKSNSSKSSNHSCQEIRIKCSQTFTNQWFPDVKGDNITGWPMFVVPNIVHYIVLDEHQLDFVHYLSILSVLDNHEPDEIIIHCNCDTLTGVYWNGLLPEFSYRKTVIKIRNVEKPTRVWENKLNEEKLNWHAADVLRLRILMEFGGIYLDRDMFVVGSLNRYRYYEMSLGWEEDHFISNQILIANRKARFLRLWYHSYKSYNASKEYTMAAELPTQDILKHYPNLVHRVVKRFGVNEKEMSHYLYRRNTRNWKKDFDAIHLSMRQGMVNRWTLDLDDGEPTLVFDAKAIKTSGTTFGQMARSVVFKTTKIIIDELDDPKNQH